MHELGIAEAIVSIAAEHAAGRKVERVEVKIGHLRQVAPSALEFAFELVAHGTSVEGAELAIEHVPARIVCRGCASAGSVNEFPFACPACGNVDIDVESGDELYVDSLEVVDEIALSGRS
jgi:hydrogenase nickel incorporation protein HypA/HybF